MIKNDTQRNELPTLTLMALGVVYGDIGTSPLYAVKETFDPSYGIPLSTGNIIGGISAIFWSLMIVVSLKYVTLVMRANNKNEGGTMALLALVTSGLHARPILMKYIVPLGLIGAALFLGDAVLTPAISVLSAVEGLEVRALGLKPFVIPISVGVLIGLFLLQRRGTATVGSLFGPLMVAWFIILGAAGAHEIFQHPSILAALNPLNGIGFVTQHGIASFLVLGAVLLAFTGTEALYADMGHFGSRAIRAAWFGLVFPALALNYLGQGALLITLPSAIENPFYLLFPQWALYFMVGLATAATIIASQATITGAFSLTKQAIQLGYLPRMRVVQTSEREIGQIYIPIVNWSLMVMVIAAIIGFGSSEQLASAYGTAVSGEMLITTVLTFFVIRYLWGYKLLFAVLATGFFLLIDLAFLTSSLTKIADGAWFPIMLGIVIFTLMISWYKGRQVLFKSIRTSTLELKPFLELLMLDPPTRVPGTAIFLTGTPELVPNALLHNLKHNCVLHQRVIFLSVMTHEVPYIPLEDRLIVKELLDDIFMVEMSFGFKDEFNVTHALENASSSGVFHFNSMESSFFLSRETIVPVRELHTGMATWQEHLFAILARNAGSAVDYFRIPMNQVIEIGSRVEM